MTFDNVRLPGLVPFALVRSQGGSEGFVRLWGACATLVHAFCPPRPGCERASMRGGLGVREMKKRRVI